MKELQVVLVGNNGTGKKALTRKLLQEFPCQHNNVSHKAKVTADDCAEIGIVCAFSGECSHCACDSKTSATMRARFRIAQRDCDFIIPSSIQTFLKSLATGFNANAVLLAVDGSKGVTELTCQYAYLAAMFGIKEVITVINKMDLILYDRATFEAISERMRIFLKGLKMNIIAVIPASAQNGDNIVAGSTLMKWSSSPTLMRSLGYIGTGRDLTQMPLRVLVQYSYVSDGQTTVLGKVISGTLHKNDVLTFSSVNHTTRLSSMKVSSQERTLAEPAEPVTLTLEDPGNIKRGQVGFDMRCPPLISKYLVGRVFWAGNEPLNLGDQVNIFCGTACCCAQVDSISEVVNPLYSDIACNTGDRLPTSHVGKLGITLDTPVCVDPISRGTRLSRFGIIKNHVIVGGGILE